MERQEHISDINTLCRTCRQVFSNDALAIKHDIFLIPDLDKKLVFCTSLNVGPQDGCPKYLCEDCYSKVIEFYQFQTMCVESAKLFDELLQQLPSEDIIEDEQPICELLEIKVLDMNDELEMETEYCSEEDSAKQKGDIVNIEVMSDHSDFHIENSYKEQEDEELLSDQSELDITNSNKEFSDDSDFDVDISNPEQEKVQPNESHPKQTTSHIKYACLEPGCHHVYKYKQSLNTHMLKVHPDETSNPSKFFCTELGCNSFYKYKSAFKNHLRKIHMLEPEPDPEPEMSIKPHVCEFCGEVFRQRNVLNVHRYRHKDVSERPFGCEYAPECELRFITRGTLKIHMMRHADIKKFVCPHCGLRKTTSQELKKHMNYHTQERKWPCSICKKECNSADNLKVHERNVHERAKDYECRFCAKRFVKSATLKYHEMSHTGEKPLVCTECGKRYLERHRLQKHMKKQHKEKKEPRTSM